MQGQPIGEYELLSQLGSGSFGTVWAAKHRSADSWRAIKVARDPALVEQFRREFEVLDRLDHYDLVTSGEAPAIIFEYVEGQDLEKLLKERGQLPWRRAVDIALQVLDGLAVAHEAGLLHRDIRPSNILLTEDGHVKIADFGLAAAAERTGSVDWSQRSGTSRPAGTYDYMAPEVHEGKQATPPSDLYSLAVMLYQCLTGRLPRGAVRPPSAFGCPVGLDGAVLALMSDEVAWRPATAAATAALLRAADASAAAPTVSSTAAPTVSSTAAPTDAPAAAPTIPPTRLWPGPVASRPTAALTPLPGRALGISVAIGVGIAILPIMAAIALIRGVPLSPVPDASPPTRLNAAPLPAAPIVGGVAVPFVVRLSEDEAVAELQAVGLTAELTRLYPLAPADAWVQSQTVVAGTVVARGTAVGLTIVSPGRRHRRRRRDHSR